MSLNKSKQERINEATQAWLQEQTKASEAHDIAYYSTEDEEVRRGYVGVHIQTHERLKAKLDRTIFAIEMEPEEE